MKLRLTLILFGLLGIGLFAQSQDKKKAPSPPAVENGPDAIPVIVKSNKRSHVKPPPPPAVEITKFDPPAIRKNGEKPPPPQPAKGVSLPEAARPDVPPPPKLEATKFNAPGIRRDAEKFPPPPVKPVKMKGAPVRPDAPPPLERTE